MIVVSALLFAAAGAAVAMGTWEAKTKTQVTTAAAATNCCKRDHNDSFAITLIALVRQNPKESICNDAIILCLFLCLEVDNGRPCFIIIEPAQFYVHTS